MQLGFDSISNGTNLSMFIVQKLFVGNTLFLQSPICV